MTTEAAEGLARLLYNGRTRRADVISELLLLFFSNTVQPSSATSERAGGKKIPVSSPTVSSRILSRVCARQH